MKKSIITLLFAGIAISTSAQDNMEAFRHLSVDAEIGLHGIGVELALPIQKHLVLKAGYNFAPEGDLFNTDISIDTKELKEAQEQYTALTSYQFQNKFEDESKINAGVRLGVTNYKVMINYYPFMNRRFYLAGGVYYTAGGSENEPLIALSGKTTEKDWAALQELNGRLPESERKEMALELGDTKYPVIEKDGCGYMAADFKIDPLKYYVGLGTGRCIPNGRVGLQLEVGAMIYQNSVLNCQDKEVQLNSLGDSFGSDVKEILEYVDKYPIYPQVTLRLCFRAF